MRQRFGEQDLYATLGVDRSADPEAIKKAYRQLAREAHPDANPDDPSAEERFKTISRAHHVLSDPERRRAYDEFGDVSLDPNFDAEAARRASQNFGGRGSTGGFDAFGAEGLGSIFEEFFGGGGTRGPARPSRGADIEAQLELSFHEAALGGVRRVGVARPIADGSSKHETLSIRIPPGVADGGRIRLSGKGAESPTGGPPGDLLARIRVRPHPVFKRVDRDVHMDVPISVTEAVLGADVEIPTLEGRIGLRVPPGTDGGTRLRVRAKGLPADKKKPAGDLYATVRIRVPKDLDDETRQRFETLRRDDDASLRNDLFRDDE